MIPLKEKDVFIRPLLGYLRRELITSDYVPIDTIQFSLKTFFLVFDTYRNNCVYAFKTNILHILVRRTMIRAGNLDNNSTRTNKHLETKI